jgi:hypothetical protein
VITNAWVVLLRRSRLEPLLTPTFLRITGTGLAYFTTIRCLVPALPRYVEVPT